MSNSINILGLHYFTILCARTQRTFDSYTQVLGQHFVKKTVNFGVPDYNYFGEEAR